MNIRMEELPLTGQISAIRADHVKNMKLMIRGDARAEQPRVLVPAEISDEDKAKNRAQIPRPRVMYQATRKGGLLAVRSVLPPEITSMWQGGLTERYPTPERPAVCMVTLPMSHGQSLGALAVTGENVRLELHNLRMDTAYVDRRTQAIDGSNTGSSVNELAQF